MIDFNKIKLVIWDLDNTFWTGTISESKIEPIVKNIALIRALTDGGIINSICSKNTFEVAEQKLKELGIWDFFVFPSIEWTPKGQRIKNQIKSMSLRAENVLFIDDEITNLEEARHYSPELMVGKPDVIENLYSFAATLEKKDTELTRLKQYKLLEQKDIENKKYDNNEDFLFASNIEVVIQENCIDELERIHELIQRSNQLNYTKKRITIDELSELIVNPSAKCGYVSVKDKFGEYGIVGFYAQLNNKLEHFLFSCRTIGQGVEQYVYATLNYPDLQVNGAVTSNLTNALAPKWINQDNESSVESIQDNQQKHSNCRILVKGPCDLLKAMTYLKHAEFFTTEFTYINEKFGNTIDAHNHSVHIIGLNKYTLKDKQEIIEDCIFVDPAMLDGSFFCKEYDIIFLSTLIESNHGIYKKKDSNIHVAFGESSYPLTDSRNWSGYVDGTFHTANNSFTLEYLEAFSTKYSYEGKTTPRDYVERIKIILALLNTKTVLCLLLGSELPYAKNTNPAYSDRHIYHAELNAAIRSFAKDTNRIKLIEINDFIKNENDYTSSINHFTARVYYEISQAMVLVLNEVLSLKVEKYSSTFIYIDMLIEKLKAITKGALGSKNNRLYKAFKSVYLKLGRRK